MIDPPFGSHASPSRLQEAFRAAADARKAHPEVFEQKLKTLTEVSIDRDYASHIAYPGDEKKPCPQFGEYVTLLQS